MNEFSLEGLPEQSTCYPWHRETWARLQEQRTAGQLPHALMLLGPPGSGKSQFALALARSLLCAATQQGVNCGQCQACVLSAAGSHGDFRWLQPQPKSRVIKIEQIREAISFTQGTAIFDKAKVVVFAPAEAMNVNACNALLKSLEEPTEETYLILVCGSLHGLPATIRSRCQLQRLPGPTSAQAHALLETETGDRQVAEQLLLLADGNAMLAREMYRAGQMDVFASRRVALRALLTGKLGFEEVSALCSDMETDQFLDFYARELRKILKRLTAQQLVSPQGRATFELLDRTQQLQGAVMAGSNPGKQLLVDLLLSKSHTVLGASWLGDTI